MALPIYLDYAATTPLAPEVLNEMTPFFLENFGNASSRHHAYGWLAEEAVEEAKERIAKAFKCKKNEVVFTSGATESINLALKNKIGRDNCVCATAASVAFTIKVLRSGR